MKPLKKAGNSPADMLSRLGILIGVPLALTALALAFSGYLWGLVLLIPAVLLTGWRRIAQYITFS
jgi:hypothetical protein